MSAAWLRDLEERVREASSRLEALRRENESLRARLAERESAAPAEDPEAAAWREERDEVKQRVEALVAHLESLLGPGERP